MSAHTDQEPKIGDRVRASMDGKNWFTGKYVTESELFCQYGVLRDDIKEVRFFTTAKVHAGCCCAYCKDGTLHLSDCAVHNEPAYPIGPCDCGAAIAKAEGEQA